MTWPNITEDAISPEIKVLQSKTLRQSIGRRAPAPNPLSFRLQHLYFRKYRTADSRNFTLALHLLGAGPFRNNFDPRFANGVHPVEKKKKWVHGAPNSKKSKGVGREARRQAPQARRLYSKCAYPSYSCRGDQPSDAGLPVVQCRSLRRRRERGGGKLVAPVPVSVVFAPATP